MARGSFSPWRWLASLTWGSFWALPTLLLMASILVAGLFLWADAEGLSVWLYAQGWPLAMAGGTAQELASVLVGVHAAFLTLYFSITLLVLTLAASNLGVRLIDRWIAKEMTRWTLGFLLGGFGWAVLVLWAVDPDATGPEVARGSLTALLGYTLFLTAWLAGALHDLGRTIHIDIDIAEIGTEGKERQDYFQNVAAAPHPGFDGTVFYAPKDGYIEGVDFRALVKLVEKAGQRMQLDMGVGRYVMAGEPLGRFETGSDQGEAAAKLFSFGRFRAGAQGGVFDARLLVEVAARALSPAINDFFHRHRLLRPVWHHDRGAGPAGASTRLAGGSSLYCRSQLRRAVRRADGRIATGGGGLSLGLHPHDRHAGPCRWGRSGTGGAPLSAHMGAATGRSRSHAGAGRDGPARHRPAACKGFSRRIGCRTPAIAVATGS